ncbi:Melanoma-Associated Antigen 8 [Manis pentadactyla]|nr:Melanoma-Associated Antigen 8 [Manis pentadactyla]
MGGDDALHKKKVQLVAFLLLKYRAKELTTKAEMLERVTQDHQDHFPVIFSQASKDLQLVFGMDVKEVDPSGHSYVLVPTLGLTWNGVTEE